MCTVKIRDRVYAYRSVRRNGRVDRLYLGAGTVALAATQALEEERSEKQRAKQEARDLIDGHEAAIRSMSEVVDGIVATALLCRGWVKHNRGYRLQPRKAKTMFDAEILHDALEAERAKRLFDADPDGKLAEEYGGNLPKRVEEAIVTKFSDTARGREAIRRAARKVRADLTGHETPTAIERIIIDRCVVAWLDAHLADLLAMEGVKGLVGVPPELDNLLERRRDRASRRLLAAMRALALVRRAAPSVNVTVVKTRRRRDPRPSTHEVLARAGRN